MISIQAIPHLIIKSIFIIELFLCNVKSESVFNKTFEFNSITSGLKDYVCSGRDVLKIATTISDLQCSYTCGQDLSCESFFYYHGNRECVTCSSFYTDTSGLSVYVGMHYYRVWRQETWNEWGSWSECSATCNTGTRTRTRTCHTDSPVPCYSDSQETENCNTYSCLPYAKTCTEWASKGLNQSTTVQIDPLGSGAVNVYCDFDFEPGKAFTRMNHNKEAETKVSGYEACASYSISLTYDIGLDGAKAVADLSTDCRQFVKWRCLHTEFSNCAYWENRNGQKSTYFTGSPPPGKYCACGDTNSCSNSNPQCNCDNNDATWREDSGYVTDSTELPITGWKAGDTGSVGIEEGFHTIGPLLCA